MCGIFGGSARVRKKLDINKLNTLGLFNTTRGTDGAGYYYSGNIVKGANTLAHYGNLIMEKGIVRGNLKHDVFIGHTRKSSSGGISLDNTHPHVSNDLILVHNGTLKNVWQLCNENKINHGNIRVDSLGLVTLLSKTGWDVLNKYTGTAAIAVASTSEDGVLYLFHGASRNIRNGDIYEERPLFILEQREGIYFSSLEESLNIINDNPSKYKTCTLPHNGVFKIKNGEIDDDFLIEIKREDVNIPKTVYTPPSTFYTNYNNKTPSKPNKKIFLEDIEKPALYKNTDIYCHLGLYYINNVLAEGRYLITRKGKVIKEGETIPPGELAEVFFFIKGVMMRNEDNYNRALEFVNNSINPLGALSSYSKYPVYINKEYAKTVPTATEGQWLLYNVSYTGGFDPKFSIYRYQVEAGATTSVKILDHKVEKLQSAQDIADTVNLPESFSAPEEEYKSIVKHSLYEIFETDEVLLIPEPLLCLIDYYVSTKNKNFTLESVVNETSNVVKYMLNNKVSFREFLETCNDETFLLPLSFDNIISESIKLSLMLDPTASSVKDLVTSTNRYNFIELYEENEECELDEEVTVTDTEESTEEDVDDKSLIDAEIQDEELKQAEKNFKFSIYDKLKESLKDLLFLADQLQTIDEDEPQEIARDLYIFSDEKIKTLKNIFNKEFII